MADETRRNLSERRAVLDSVETIAAFAREMSEFLRTSELTESKAFIRSFVKEIVVQPGTATIRYTIPTPPDSPIGRRDAAEVELPEAVRSTVSYGCEYQSDTSSKQRPRSSISPRSRAGSPRPPPVLLDSRSLHISCQDVASRYSGSSGSAPRPAGKRRGRRRCRSAC
ncbi:MAG: hypothetical protein OXC71_06755 [Chloroflexi bacterium]|nr:hypothetical protein [Chloroflexota bacterium]